MSHVRALSTTQRGASLVIGLVLLMILSVLAISTMNSATFGLTMAGNAQYSENAFQMAETGIEVTMTMPNISDQGPPRANLTTVRDAGNNPIGTYQTNTTYMECGRAFGQGEEFRAYHFQTDSTGTSARDATSLNQQDFYIQGPNACD